MEYRLTDYNYNYESNNKIKKIYQNTHTYIYHNNTNNNTTNRNTTNRNTNRNTKKTIRNNKKTKKNKISLEDFASNRILGGLLSIKLLNNHDVYIDRFNNLTTKYIDKQIENFNNTKKYKYGIDEVIILYIIPQIRNELSKHDNNNLVIILNNTVESCIAKSSGLCKDREDQSHCCNFSDIYFNGMFLDDLEEESKNLVILGSQYEEIYDILGSKPFNSNPFNINTYELSIMSIFSILKGIDYEVKYIFTFMGTKIYKLYHKIKRLNPLIDFCELYIIDISEPETMISKVGDFLSEISIAYSESNFKPLLTYPKKIDNELAGISVVKPKTFLYTILEPLDPLKHMLIV